MNWMSVLTFIVVGMTFGVMLGSWSTRRYISIMLRERASHLTIQSAVELKTIAGELDGR